MIELTICVLVLPYILGLIWDNGTYENTIDIILFRYTSGFFTVFSIFEVVSVPLCFLQTRFTTLVYAFSIALLIVCVGSILCYHKSNGVISIFPSPKIKKLDKWELLYLSVFFVIFIYMLYKAAIMDIGWRSYDDATYLVYANSAIYDNSMYLVDDMTGLPQALDVQRSLQGSLLLISYLSYISGISVTIMAHTIFAVGLLGVAFSIYYLLGDYLLDKKENIFIFLIILCVLYIFGHFSEYSMTFRLLGPIWQGKAILAVILTPFLLLVLSQILQKKFEIKNGIFIFVLSISAISMSLAGAIVMVALTVLLVPLFFRQTKEKNSIFYILFGCAFPGFISIVYLLIR